MAWLKKVFNFVMGGTYSASPEPLTEGQSGPVLVDPLGRVQVVGGAPAVGQRVVQLGAADRGQLKAGPGQLVELVVWNASGDTLWLQIHDSSTEPTDGAVPVDQIMVPAGASLSWRPVGTLACSAGIWWAASTSSIELSYIGSASMGLTAGVL